MTRPVLQQFEEIVTGRDEDINLVRAALVVASNEYPGLDIDTYLDRFAVMAAELRDRVAGYSDAIDDYHHYLMLSPEAHDASYIKTRLMDLKLSAERLH